MSEQRSSAGQVGPNPDETAGTASAGRRTPRSPHERHPFRAFFARNRGLDLTYRIVIGAVGAAIVVGGIALIPLPGPGWLIVFAGLAVLATEFAWAGRLLDFARDRVRSWTDWATRQSLLVRMAIGLAGLLLVAGALWAYVAVWGVPAWLPGG